MEDREISTLQQVVSLFDSVSPEARLRIYKYVGERFVLAQSLDDSKQLEKNVPNTSTTGERSELEGIARLLDDGSLRMTVRDLKAGSGIDAAKRLVYVALAAHEQLTGVGASSRRVVTPILKDWRLYDGNARRLIASDKGILRNGDILSLDAHARREAERYISEIRDETVAGRWQGSKRTAKRSVRK